MAGPRTGAPIAVHPNAAHRVAGDPVESNTRGHRTPETPHIGVGHVITAGPAVAVTVRGPPVTADPVAVRTHVANRPVVAGPHGYGTPVARCVGVTVPVTTVPAVTHAGVATSESGDPIARVGAVTRLIHVLFFFDGVGLAVVIVALIFGLPLWRHVAAIHVGSVAPVESVTLFGAPESQLPHAVFAAVARFPTVALGCGLLGQEVIVDPVALFVVAGLLPVEALFAVSPPEAFDHLTIGADYALFPDVVVAGLGGIFNVVCLVMFRRIVSGCGRGQEQAQGQGYPPASGGAGRAPEKGSECSNVHGRDLFRRLAFPLGHGPYLSNARAREKT